MRYLLVPKCATPVKKLLTRLLDAPPTHHYHKDTIQVPLDEDTPPRCCTKNKGKEHQQKAQMALEPPEESSSEEESSEEEESSSSEEEEPPMQRRAPPPDPLLGPRRSTRETRVPKKPDNVYGDHHPVEILRDPTGRKKKCEVKGPVPKPIENVPGPSCLIPNKTPPISPTESELDIERGLDYRPEEKNDEYGLEPPQEEEEEDPYGINLYKLCQEGGVKLLSYLMAKAVSPTVEAPTHPKSWGCKDISHLPELEKKEWQNACLQELEALRRSDVYELVQCPRGHKVIKNRWVFDVKTDGQKKACLVAKGFSQVEGLD